MKQENKRRTSRSFATSAIVMAGALVVLIVSFVSAQFQNSPVDKITTFFEMASPGFLLLFGLIYIYKIFVPKLYQKKAPLCIRLFSTNLSKSPETALTEELADNGVTLVSPGSIGDLEKTKNVICGIEVFNKNITITNILTTSDDCVNFFDVKE